MKLDAVNSPITDATAAEMAMGAVQGHEEEKPPKIVALEKALSTRKLVKENNAAEKARKKAEKDLAKAWKLAEKAKVAPKAKAKGKSKAKAKAEKAAPAKKKKRSTHERGERKAPRHQQRRLPY